MLADRSRGPGSLLALLVVVVAVTVASAGRSWAQGGERVAAGEAALAAGEPARAEALFRQVAAAAPGDLEAWGGLARALAAQGRGAEAERILAEVAGGAVESGRWDLAARFLRDHLHLADASAQLHALLGRAEMLGQQWVAARRHLQRAVELGASDARSRLYLASASWELGELQAAERQLRQLAATGAPLADRQLGSLLLWQGRGAEAVPWLERAQQAQPGPDVAFELARALDLAGRRQEAAALYHQVLAAHPGHTRARYNLAQLLVREGERQQAAGHLERYRRDYAAQQRQAREGGLQRARLDHGWGLLEQGEAAAAAAHFATLPETVESLAGLAAARSALGDHGGAATALERAVALAPERQDLRLRLAEERSAAGGGG
ncbi:MAG TPA: tetratricopeptide repeat protein [Thermoanaerobaculia bacterium]|nr:tetratricopeptide repeat protein [Thermoanaerobaculia bacterium]